MTLKQINNNLWVQELTLDSFEVRGALVLGQTRAVIWDTLSHPRDMEPYLPIIGDRELYVVYSHADWDHIWGTAGLPQPAVIIAQTLCRDRFGTDVPQKLRAMQTSEPNKWDEIQLIAPTVAFEDNLLIDLGGITMTLHHLPGHTEDCLVAMVKEVGQEETIALMGDTIETPFPVISPESPLTEWIQGLKRWYTDETITTVIPSHGPIGGQGLIVQTIDYLERIYDGKTIEVPDNLSCFYQETHEDNLKWQQS